MEVVMSGELVFQVHGTSAVPAREISLAAAGLREREHLQEWVLANPDILGPDVLVVTSEFDRWMSKDGKEPDRLDILGLGPDGRLVVAELKRDRAPDYVTTQAINYAARASRFSLEDLADVYVSFSQGADDAPSTTDEALAALTAHAPELSTDTLRNPRISLVAGAFPAAVTSAAVWLTEQGVDMTLIQVRAYEWGDQHAITVSRVWPVADVEDYVVSPARRESASAKAADALPAVPWDAQDLARLAEMGVRETILATLDKCSQSPGEWVSGLRVMEQTGRAKAQHSGDYAGFSIQVRRKFDRSNAPWEMSYREQDGAPSHSHYRLDSATAEMWRALRGLSTDAELAVAPAGPTSGM